VGVRGSIAGGPRSVSRGTGDPPSGGRGSAGIGPDIVGGEERSSRRSNRDSCGVEGLPPDDPVRTCRRSSPALATIKSGPSDDQVLTCRRSISRSRRRKDGPPRAQVQGPSRWIPASARGGLRWDRRPSWHGPAWNVHPPGLPPRIACARGHSPLAMEPKRGARAPCEHPRVPRAPSVGVLGPSLMGLPCALGHGGVRRVGADTETGPQLLHTPLPLWEVCEQWSGSPVKRKFSK